MNYLGGWLDRYFWVVCILTVFIRYQYRHESGVRQHSNRRIDEIADTQSGRYNLWWRLAPWVAMGAGQMVGGIISARTYLRPQDGNTWVTVFYAVIFLESLVSSAWVVVGGGAAIAIQRHLYRVYLFGHEVRLGVRGVKIVAAMSPVVLACVVWILCKADISTVADRW